MSGPDCSRELSVDSGVPYLEVVRARRACGCLVCLESIDDAQRRAEAERQQSKLADVIEAEGNE